MVETRVGRDAVEPGPNHGSSFEAGPPLPCSKQRLLHQVLRLIERPEHAIAVQVKLFPIRLGESGESGLISRDRRLPLIRVADSQKVPAAPGVRCKPWSPSRRRPNLLGRRHSLAPAPLATSGGHGDTSSTTTGAGSDMPAGGTDRAAGTGHGAGGEAAGFGEGRWS